MIRQHLIGSDTEGDKDFRLRDCFTFSGWRLVYAPPFLPAPPIAQPVGRTACCYCSCCSMGTH